MPLIIRDDHVGGPYPLVACEVGGFALMPANMNHYAYTTKETIILLHGQGPVKFKYVNPADDPRNKK